VRVCFSFGVSVVQAYKSGVNEPWVNGATAATNLLCPSSGSPGSSLPTFDRVSETGSNGTCQPISAGPGDQYSKNTIEKNYTGPIRTIDETMAKCGGDIAKAAELLVMTEPALLRKIRSNVILRNNWINTNVPVEPPKPLEPRDPEEGLRRQIRLMEEELETGNFTHARRDKLRDTLARYHAILQRYQEQRIEREKLAKGVGNPGGFKIGFDDRRGPRRPPTSPTVRLKFKSDAEVAEMHKATDEQQ